MNTKKITLINSWLKDQNQKYSFWYYPHNSLRENIFDEAAVRAIEGKTAWEAVTNLLDFDNGSKRKDVLERYFAVFKSKVSLPDDHEGLCNESLCIYILADLYQLAYIDRHEYYAWKPQVNGLMGFSFRGFDFESLFLSFALNHRRNTSNLEPHRNGARAFLRKFRSSCSDILGIGYNASDEIFLKDLVTAGYVEKIHLRQNHQYRRGL